MAEGPLEGVRVLELGSFIAGPFAGQMLADLGADVIKVEPPGSGDAMRRWGRLIDGRSIWWSALARNKRLVAIDLRRPEGQALAFRLATTCDVVVENFTPGRLEEWDLSYERLSEANPRLVMTRLSGFGQTGPRASDPGFGAIAEAMGGLREVTGSPDRDPARAAVSLGDQIASLFAVIGTLTALRQVDRDGLGQVVDVALYESVFALMESTVADYVLGGHLRTRAGGSLPGAAPSNAYPTIDGRLVVIAANSDASWSRLCGAMGRADLATDPRYAKHEDRGARQAEVDALVGAWTQTLAVDELTGLFAGAGVPNGLIYKAPDMLEDPQFLARKVVRRVWDGALGRDVPMADVLPRLTRTPGSIRWAGDAVGAHTHQVLEELGVPPEDRRDLVAAGVIGTGTEEQA